MEWSADGREPRARVVDVACVGEALALVPALPEPGAPVSGPAMLAGAEANVAAGLAAAGVAVAWVSRLGGDELGTFLRTELERRGVDVAPVEIDPEKLKSDGKSNPFPDNITIEEARKAIQFPGFRECHKDDYVRDYILI